MLVRLAAIALALTTLPASAAFLERHDHWTVTDADPPDCVAVNRPPYEFRVQPYVALSIRQSRNMGARLFVFAWPHTFKYADRVTIEVGGFGPGAQLAGEALDSYVVVTREDLPQDLVADMQAARFVSFEIAGLGQALMFDVSQLEAIMKSLDACVRQLPR